MLRMVLAEVPSTTPPLLELRKQRVGRRSGEEGEVGRRRKKEEWGGGCRVPYNTWTRREGER